VIVRELLDGEGRRAVEVHGDPQPGVPEPGDLTLHRLPTEGRAPGQPRVRQGDGDVGGLAEEVEGPHVAEEGAVDSKARVLQRHRRVDGDVALRVGVAHRHEVEPGRDVGVGARLDLLRPDRGRDRDERQEARGEREREAEDPHDPHHGMTGLDSASPVSQSRG
jgi:hypothetical protein